MTTADLRRRAARIPELRQELRELELAAEQVRRADGHLTAEHAVRLGDVRGQLTLAERARALLAERGEK